MLINKGITVGEVVSIKLINGDELIARLDGETADEISVDRPLAITMGPQGMGLIPWIFLGEQKIVNIKKSHVFAMVPSKKEASDQYMQGTTGIALR